MNKNGEARTGTMEDVHFRDPASTLRPQSLAIVGASDRARWPERIFTSLREGGFPGRVYPINPRLKEVWGTTCYPDLAALPEPVEHAVVIVPAPAVQQVLEEGVRSGLKSATVYAAHIGEGTDPDVVARGAALKDMAARSGLVVAGPNCMGGNSLHDRYFGYPNTDLCKVPSGAVSIVSQSGGTLQFIVTSAAARGIGFSHMVSSGNELCLDLADYVNFLVDDPHTKVIALFIEGIRRADAFMVAAGRALAAGKPIIAIKTGRSKQSREAAQSHTGAIAGDFTVFEAMCERYGITLCATLEDMFETMLVFQAGRLPRGPRVGFITTSGGTVDLLYDYFEEIGGIEVPDFMAETKARIAGHATSDTAIKNPLDSGIPSSEAAGAEISKAVAADPNIDILAWAGVLPGGSRKRDPDALRSVLASTDKPVIAFGRTTYMVGPDALAFQKDVGIPFLQGLKPTLRAIAALGSYSACRARPLPQRPAVIASRLGDAATLADDLAAAGIPVPRSAMAATPAEAAIVATGIGFPVALKIVSPDISHKTEVEGVRLALSSAAIVAHAAGELMGGVRHHAPSARIDGLLVQEMVSGVEVLLGARTDPQYGPFLVLGTGGVFVEVLDDVAARLLPVTSADVHDMIRTLKLGKLLAGFRGRPACDVEALVAAVCRFGDFFLRHRTALSDLEINPLIVRRAGEGVCAVDIRHAPATS